MTAPARLLSVRLQGFKSFAERTHVTFGPGISAVVGPNGSGKSNLADALRWALGEQGRALRTRKAEDVIWAGSERRAATGMADVELALDNGDALLPVEYGIVELGRRLYRSGENEYRVNHARVRLRDLVDLLDAAHLAENAFLFIGQGMVDQALALRPEERRPLFEEVAGVRRHERRRRRAEEQLVEADANLARIDDIVAELRPQARRLAAQAEQQATRETAAESLADALLASAGARWHVAAGRVAMAAAGLAAARAAADVALGALIGAEEAAAAITSAMASRSIAALERRTAHDAAVEALTAFRLRDGRAAVEAEGVAHERARLEAERLALDSELETQRRVLAEPAVEPDVALERAAEEADRALADALAELAAARATSRAHDEEAAALRRAEAARRAEAEETRRRLADAEARLAVESARAEGAEAGRASAAARLGEFRDALEASLTADARAGEDEARARAAVEAGEATRMAAAGRLASAEATDGAIAAAIGSLRSQVEAAGSAFVARASSLGGTSLAAGLDVEPSRRTAVDAALGSRASAVRLPQARVVDVVSERGTLVVSERLADASAAAASGRATGAEAALLEAVEAAGGGRLVEAVRRDPTGAVRALLERVVWLPDLAACLAIQAQLPAGWLAVASDGSAAVDPISVTLGRGDGIVARQAELGRLEREAVETARAVAAARREAERTAAAAVAAGRELAGAQENRRRSAAARRAAEEAERVAGRAFESATREAAWSAAQLARLSGEVRRLRDDADRAGAGMSSSDEPAPEAPPSTASTGAGSEAAVTMLRSVSSLVTWEARAGELRDRRARLLASLGVVADARRRNDADRARAEASIAMLGERATRLETELSDLAERASGLGDVRGAIGGQLADAADVEREARAELEGLLAADAADRERLAAAERDAATIRDRLRRAEDGARSAERTELEARLGLEALRDGLLVELTALGGGGRRRLESIGGREPSVRIGSAPEAVPPPSGESQDLDDETRAIEAALDAAGAVWAETPPSGEPPSAGRLAALRRRFHELGAGNPFAAEEHRTVRERLDGLEAQAADLRVAIGRTRALIEELDGLITSQFRTTFDALESAFDRRFRQLFGGGYARLSLTEPTDLAATGVDIVARPPGKKAQALAMLSGGERALTAVALLFAMLEVRPVPFCVLDEVDAALDEANIGRFTTALRELSGRTQCIVITHNRGTIEIADALYGVTVGDDSVSRVISLRLEDAQALAEAGRPVDGAVAAAAASISR